MSAHPGQVGQAKAFKTHGEQIELLKSRGMCIDDVGWARHILERINYYRLSGYWYPFRKPNPSGTGRSDSFVQGTNLRDVVALYEFDERIRAATFVDLTVIELVVRAMLGHELGRIDPIIHLHPELLGPVARQSGSATDPSSRYAAWAARYEKELTSSREDFVKHHNQKYGGQLPIWAAVEIMDWGSLTHLFELSPIAVRDLVASRANLTAPQLGSWMKCLNIVRNYSAHHARMFNRVYTLKPRLPGSELHPGFGAIKKAASRCFGQLSLIQYLLTVLDVGDKTLLPSVLATYPHVRALPMSHMGAPSRWQEHRLWCAEVCR